MTAIPRSGSSRAADPVVRREVVFSGRVQGVGFRATFQRHAEDAAVRGWVRNEPDGTVRAHLLGPAQAVDRVILRVRGSFGSSIGDIVEVEPDSLEEFRSFRIVRN